MNPDVFFSQNKRFFFSDRELTANYVKLNCPDELAHVLKTAEDTVNQTFLFNLRWDMERTYTPVTFKGEIDWLTQPADDSEWIFAFNRMRFWICLGQAYAVTKDEKYAECFAHQLTHWIDSVPRSNPANAKAWRTIEAGLRLEYWLKAMCYFKGSPAITETVMEKFCASMEDHATFILSVYNSFNYMSNWGVLANHGLFLAGVMLPDTDEKSAARHSEYRKIALERLSQIASVQIYSDGMQWEQSPMYHNEVAHDFLDVVIIARRNNIELPKYIEEKTKEMCHADAVMQKPNGFELSMGDSDDIDQRDIVTKGAAVFRDPFLKALGYKHLDFDTVWDVGAEIAADYDAIPAVPSESLTNVLNASGNICFRSSWEEDAVFLHFHCGTLGAGHGHADTLHIDLFANGEDILADCGRFTYVDKPERYEFKDSTAHNTTTVDGKNFYTSIDSWGCSKLNKTVNLHCTDTERYAFCEGGHLNYMLDSKDGVFVNRKIIYIKPDIFVIADEFYANSPHTYQQYLHFADSAKVCAQTPDAEVNRYYSMQKLLFKSAKNRAEFFMLSGADGNTDCANNTKENTLCTELFTGRISKHYNTAENAPVAKTSWNADGFTSLFTVISLNGAKACVRKVPILSNFKNARFPHSMIEALEIEKEDRAYTVVIAHQEYASPTDTFCAGGIQWKDVSSVPLWQPGNKTNNGTSDRWGAINCATGCTGFGQVVVFDRSIKSSEKQNGGGFRTGIILAN